MQMWSLPRLFAKGRVHDGLEPGKSWRPLYVCSTVSKSSGLAAWCSCKSTFIAVMELSD